VGIPKGSDQCQAINDAITKMKDEGAWEKALTSNTEGTGYTPDEKLNSGPDAELVSCEA